MEKKMKIKEEEFLKIMQKVDPRVFSCFERNFFDLYASAPKDKRIKIFNALPETVEGIIENSRFFEESNKQKINQLKKEIKWLKESIESAKEDNNKEAIKQYLKELEIFEEILKDYKE